jgi:hypothetical protein
MNAELMPRLAASGPANRPGSFSSKARQQQGAKLDGAVKS